MKIEGYLFVAVAVFLIPTTLVYWYFSEEEPTGTTVLGVTFGMCCLIAVYLLVTGHKIEPRDRKSVV